MNINNLARRVGLVLMAVSFTGHADERQAGVPATLDLLAYTTRAARANRAFLQRTSPLVEPYFQLQQYSLTTGMPFTVSDYRLLGRFTSIIEPTVELLQERSGGGTQPPAQNQQVREAMMDAMEPDWDYLGADRYDYRFVEFSEVGSVHCAVYEVRPIDGEYPGFKGRVYFETQAWNLVRFTGFSQKLDSKLTGFRAKDSRFRIDAFRFSAPKGYWLPSVSYLEEVPPLGKPAGPVWRGVVTFWGYHPETPQAAIESTSLTLDSSPKTQGDSMPPSCMPLQCQRMIEKQAEINVLTRLQIAGFLDNPGTVNRMCDQILVNLIVSNHLALTEQPHCRFLLTSGLEAFSVGDTIVLSRNVLDIANDLRMPEIAEAAIARILAHQLSHRYLHRTISPALVYADLLTIPDSVLLDSLDFRHSLREEREADQKATELLDKSPYKAKLGQAELVFDSLKLRAGALRALVSLSFGEHLADLAGVIDQSDSRRTRHAVDLEDPGRIHGGQLGSTLAVDRWDGTVTRVTGQVGGVFRSYELSPFVVTHPAPHLDYRMDNPAPTLFVNAAPVKPTRTPGTSRPKPVVNRRTASTEKRHRLVPVATVPLSR